MSFTMNPGIFSLTLTPSFEQAQAQEPLFTLLKDDSILVQFLVTYD